MKSHPRFVWMYEFATQGEPTPTGSQSHVVLDLEAPDAEPGQVKVFAKCPTKEAAVMTCMSLNGHQVAPG